MLFRFLKKITSCILPGSEKEISPIDDNAIYFHEDSYNQVEFIPRENLFYLKKENENIDIFSRENFDGIGFTDIYARDENPVALIDKQFFAKDLDSVISEHGIEKNQEVYTGYASERWKCKDTYAYNVIEDANIFVSTKDGIIESFWIEGFRFFESDEIKSKLRNILMDIGDQFDVVLNDWNICASIDLKRVDQINSYLNEEL